MITPTKDLDLAAFRPKFVTVMSAFGGWLGALCRPPVHHVDAVPASEQMMIRPSPHERVAIEAHREDRV
jgi:hypothetical protein